MKASTLISRLLGTWSVETSNCFVSDVLRDMHQLWLMIIIPPQKHLPYCPPCTTLITTTEEGGSGSGRKTDTHPPDCPQLSPDK
ncbi:hypothetical protein SRHO_G00226080 [Serrasalmus rhombeus]